MFERVLGFAVGLTIILRSRSVNLMKLSLELIAPLAQVK
jgi:hypothetical protein